MYSSLLRCYKATGPGNTDSGDYSAGWVPLNTTAGSHTAWTYQGAFNLRTLPYVGVVGSYSGGGYVVELARWPQQSQTIIRQLRRQLWTDRLTRAVFVEFILYNANTNLFTAAKLIFEFPPSGGILSHHLQTRVLRLYPYVGAKLIFRLMLDVAVLVFTIVYMVSQIKLVRQQRCLYFQTFWNIWECINICAFIGVVAMYALHFIAIKLTMKEVHKNPGRLFLSTLYITQGYLYSRLHMRTACLARLRCTIQCQNNSRFVIVSCRDICEF